MHKMFPYFLGSIIFMMLASIAVFALGFKTAAYIVAYPGVLSVMLGWALWIAVYDSRSRWSGVSWATRFTYLMTFRRSDAR